MPVGRSASGPLTTVSRASRTGSLCAPSGSALGRERPTRVQEWSQGVHRACDLKRRGLTAAPELAVADGALGFWQAIEEVWPKTCGQRCWVHKTANVLNKLPKSQQPKAKRALRWMAETKKDALAAFDVFVETWGVKYDLLPHSRRAGNGADEQPGIDSIQRQEKKTIRSLVRPGAPRPRPAQAPAWVASAASR